MDAPVLNLHSLFDNLRSHVDILNESIEPQFIQMALNFEDCRRRWLRFEQDLGSCKEVLAKHARNQVDVEIRRRQKAEANCEKLVCIHTFSCFTPLQPTLGIAHGDLRLDWDSSIMRTVRLKKREKRRSTSRNFTDGPPSASKRSRSTGRTSEKGNESLVAKTTVTVPADGGPIEAGVSTIEAVPYWTRSRRKTATLEWDSESVKSEDVMPNRPESDSRPQEPSTPQGNGSVRNHKFVSKAVIKPESCVPCGKRIKFAKISLKCRDCRLVTHPECRELCPLPCIPIQGGTPFKIGEGTLADYVSHVQSPMIPSLVVHCVNEIEQRGLRETGLYRLSGSDRTVKELKDKLLRGKTVPLLSKVEDIHCITGLLKDFLRNLKEPLLTFRLNRTFMEAAELVDEDNSIALMYQTISDLPQANRATLAFMAIHLQRVTQSLDTKMDIPNLARVFGPTIVGHAVPDPEPMTIIQDTKRQPKVIERLLGLPVEYWSQFMMVDLDQLQPDHMIIKNANYYTPDQKVSMLGPLTTPEHHQMNKTPSSSSLGQRMRSTLSKTTPNKSAVVVGFPSHPGNFFASPLLK
uniref:Rac GTPase-activating protein 1 n=1 Tax=Oncorhynchus tshawytscha TaxID=74940 RepID=A0A8C8C9V5_ONCTS